MKITKTNEWIVLNHTTFWLDDDGKECKLENREYRGCETIEEAQEVALNFLESRWIKEEIIIE
jgi:hypothetical protein